MSPADAARSPGIGRGKAFGVTMDGVALTAHEGETVLAVLWAAGIRSLRITARTRQPRGFFCGMGACFDCLVSIDGLPGVRACMELARPGMAISRQQDPGSFPPMESADHA